MADRILVVDDNPDILKLLEILLEGEGYAVDCSPSAEKAERMARTLPPDLAIVDVGLPGMRGFELVRRLRRFTDAPIIFLTAATSEGEQLEGFASGGTDYVLKPFLPAVLMARIRAHLEKKPKKDKDVVQAGALEIDLSSRSVKVGEIEIDLTRNEFMMLAFLLKNKGKIVNKSELMGSVWGDDWGDGHVVENTIHRLRSKLQAAGVPRSFITTHRGLGYRIDAKTNIGTVA